MSRNSKKINKILDYFQSHGHESKLTDWLDEELTAIETEYIDEVLYYEIAADEHILRFEFIFSKKINAILREMIIRMYNNVSAVKSHAYCLFSIITLLFGLCSSQSSIIFSAFFGTSLSRIPSL